MTILNNRQGREEVLRLLAEVRAAEEGKPILQGTFYAHVEVLVSVTYMGRVPAEYGAEAFIGMDSPERLQTSVQQAYKSMSKPNLVFSTIEAQMHEQSQEKEGDHGESESAGEFTLDTEEEDNEEGNRDE